MVHLWNIGTEQSKNEIKTNDNDTNKSLHNKKVSIQSNSEAVKLDSGNEEIINSTWTPVTKDHKKRFDNNIVFDYRQAENF